MTNKNKENGSLLKKLLWWIPIIILGLMFALGACTRRENKIIPDKNTGQAESTQSKSIAKESGTKQSVEIKETQGQKKHKQKNNKSKKRKNKKQIQESVSESSDETSSQEIESTQDSTVETGENGSINVEENGNYTSKDDVALYIHTYGKLPLNYITKAKAQEMGWDPEKGNLSDVLPGMSIGGSAFGNYEGNLPRATGRRYFECDIDYEGGYRGAKRLIYSNDGLVFYTEDHYKTFEQLY
ncbi:ribonuclease [Lachnoanaerobaculum saburreum F0468]|jgi:ribonuclease|uniref:Ribonuclease n=1 Tax=Lachnoanaerobaculum saburreum F0468 TaxID=1095750 RepID=I0RB59_9FIRM|nr:ribonuclease domain-containing protein [Lachnoanaerobaculum saburreum]EIC96917.1 ribonuclease [Lachnoanaerobaculum saburreum F0468]